MFQQQSNLNFIIVSLKAIIVLATAMHFIWEFNVYFTLI